MDIYKGYISEILFRTNRNIFKYIISLIVLALIMMLVSMACLAIIGIENIFFKSILIGVSSIVPIISTGIIMIPWMIVRMITSEKDLAVLLGIIYIILIVIKQGLEPFIIGKKTDFRPIATFVIFFILYIFWKDKGVILASFIILPVYIALEFFTIQSYARSNKIRNRKEIESSK